MTKIDFHTHILPGMDDGAKRSAESENMLQALYQQGVRDVVLTPHYYSDNEPLEHFLARRSESMRHLREACVPQDMTLHLGSEVYLTEYLFNQGNLTPLCIAGTHTMLVELPFEKRSSDRVQEMLARLQSDYMITPVLAHIERYAICRSEKALLRLLDMGCVLQVNLGSFTVHGKRRLSRLAARGYIGAIGTDAHNMTTRAPEYTAGYDRLRKVLSLRDIDKIQQNMEFLLQPCRTS